MSVRRAVWARRSACVKPFIVSTARVPGAPAAAPAWRGTFGGGRVRRRDAESPGGLSAARGGADPPPGAAAAGHGDFCSGNGQQKDWILMPGPTALRESPAYAV